MSNRNGFYREAWLVVAQGGWWKLGEILEQIPAGVEIDAPSTCLWIMAKRYGYLKRRGHRQTAEYAVTAECATPGGIPVKRLCAALLAMQAQVEAQP
ncbi:MAG TPA: hypothetical protein VEB23_10480 [Ramlibacter sp.]|nr:hypothetical protein [Ramlibacter sp.]